ncbi:hypothetical protein FQN55_004831 [Onygenales sp. PD_40]|nr:hypothetical protein FQN55_004831 [Onygenales sp. PD_40]
MDAPKREIDAEASSRLSQTSASRSLQSHVQLPRTLPPIRTASPQPRTRVSWSRRMEESLLEALLKAQREGYTYLERGSFRKNRWDVVVDAVQATSPHPIEKMACINRWKRFKKSWILWLKHKDEVTAAGWEWEAMRGTFSTDHATELAYFNTRPEMCEFMHGGPRFGPLLEEILGNKYIMGTRSRTSTSTVPIEGGKVEEEACSTESIRDTKTEESPKVEGREADIPLPPLPSTPRVRSSLSSSTRAPDGDNYAAVLKRSATQSPTDKRPTKTPRTQTAKSVVEELLESDDTPITLETVKARVFAPGKLAHMNRGEETLYAVTAFLREYNDLLPSHLKNQEGDIPYKLWSPMLEVFHNTANCQTYLALLSNAPRRLRREWVCDKLGLPGCEG